MRKVATSSRWGLLMGVACGLAMLSAADRAAHAELITYSIEVGGVPIPFPPPATGTPTASSYSSAELATLNSLLGAFGSAYTFQSLGGSSNWDGAPSGGILSLSGIVTVGTSGNPVLTITESESGFISPGLTGVTGTLTSSSSATFNHAGLGNSQTTNSSFDVAVTTPLITLASSSSTGPNSPNPGPPGTATIPSFSMPYEMNNFISFSLSPSTPGAVDIFGVTAQATAVPEPASVVTMLIGLPLPLVGLAWLRRRAR